MGAVERHRFVDSALVIQAYEDTSLPMGWGRPSQTQCRGAHDGAVAGCRDCSSAAGLGRVLEVGTGCGYQAAVLARLAREVYSIERLRGLHEKARTNLRPLRLANVHLILGDGMEGYAKGAPMPASSLRPAGHSCRWPGASNSPWVGVWWHPQPLPMGSRCFWWWTRPRTD